MSIERVAALAEEMVSSGKALEKFRECIRLQGGNPKVIDDTSLLPAAQGKLDVKAAASGFVTDIQCLDLGIALAMLGGGREKKEHNVDHGVGLEFHKRIGDRVEKYEKLVTIHYNSDAKLAEAKSLIANSYVVSDTAPREKRPLVRQILGA